MRLQGNTVLVTGGGSGIGLAIAVALLRQGNAVIITGRDEARLSAAAAEHPGLIARRCDVSRAQDRAELVRWLDQAHPSLNVLINNAGVMNDWTIRDGGYPSSKIEAEIATNFAAPIHLIHALLPQLLRAPKATIVNVSSGVAYAPLPKAPVYSATKAALHSFTQSLRHQLQGTSVEVVEVIPGLVSTAMTGARYDGAEKFLTPEKFAERVLRGLGRGAAEIRPGEAAAVAWLSVIAPRFVIRYMDRINRGEKP